jgi:hypothetical protein
MGDLALHVLLDVLVMEASAVLDVPVMEASAVLDVLVMEPPAVVAHILVGRLAVACLQARLAAASANLAVAAATGLEMTVLDSNVLELLAEALCEHWDLQKIESHH